MKMVEKPPIRRQWYHCPHCDAKAMLYDNTAKCSGVFTKCKNCRKEFEIKI